MVILLEAKENILKKKHLMRTCWGSAESSSLTAARLLQLHAPGSHELQGWAPLPSEQGPTEQHNEKHPARTQAAPTASSRPPRWLFRTEVCSWKTSTCTSSADPASSQAQAVCPAAATGSSHLPRHCHLSVWAPVACSPSPAAGRGPPTPYTHQHTGTRTLDPSSNWA